MSKKQQLKKGSWLDKGLEVFESKKDVDDLEKMIEDEKAKLKKKK